MEMLTYALGFSLLGGMLWLKNRHMIRKTTRHVLWFDNKVVYVGWSVFKQQFYCVIGDDEAKILDSKAHTNLRLSPIITIIENVTDQNVPHSIMERIMNDCARNARNEVTEWTITLDGDAIKKGKTKQLT